MELKDLGKRFNELNAVRTGRTNSKPDRVPSEAVLRSWARCLERYRVSHLEETGDDPDICHQLSITANVYLILRDQGEAAAVLWKLQNA